MTRAALLILLLVSPALAELRFETYRARFTSDDDALAAAIADAKSGTDPVISFYGQLTLRREPPALDRVHLTGRDIYGSTVLKSYPGGVLFRFDGRPGYSGGGLRNFSIIGGAAGNSGSYAILARSKPGYGPHGMVLENLYIGGGFYRAIEIAGHDNPNAGGLGVRQPRISNVTVFGTQAGASVYLHWTADARLEALRLYLAGGSYWELYAPWQNNPGVVLAP